MAADIVRESHVTYCACANLQLSSMSQRKHKTEERAPNDPAGPSGTKGLLGHAPLSAEITPDNRSSGNTMATHPASDAHSGWKIAFWFIVAGLLALYWTGGWGTGVHSDEIDMGNYGKANIWWYTSGGENTRFLHEPLHFAAPTLKYYGSGFEYLAQGLLAVVPTDGWEYDVRHALNQFLAAVGVMFAGLLAWRFAGWRAAVLTATLVGLTPTFWGLALFNTKDIPFAVGYVATTYFIVRLAEGFPKARLGQLAGLSTSLLFACSVRIGALIIMPLLAAIALHACYRYRTSDYSRARMRPALRWVGAISLAILIALTATVLLWPFALLDPGRNIPEAISAAINFPERVRFLFAGENYSSVQLPDYYLLRAIGNTLPLGILAIFCVGFIGLIAVCRQAGARPWLVLVMASFLPLGYAVYKEMPVYNSWRHFLFVYPPAAATLVSGIVLLIQRLRHPALLQLVLYTAVLVGLIPSTIWSLHNQPYQYQYYNETVGGYRGANYSYDTDYWQMSLREAIDWIATRDYVRQSKEPVTIATNGVHFTRLYLLAKYPQLKVRVVQSAFKGRHANDWDYAAFSNVVLPRDIARFQWPPVYTAHSVVVDGVTTAVVLADTARYDYRGFKAMEQGSSESADSLFKRYLQEIGYRSDVPAYLGPLDGYIALTRLSLHDTATADAFAKRCLVTDDLDLVGNVTAGLVALGKGNLEEAYTFLSKARGLDSTLAIVNSGLAELRARGIQ